MSETVPTAPASEFVLRGCFGKEKFAYRFEAERAARRINGSANRRRPVGAYSCGCGAYHIGGGKPRKG